MPSPAFKWVFFTTVALTITSGVSAGAIASQNHELSAHQTRVFETCNTTWNMGIGAIFGLLGSKATDLLTGDHPEGDDTDSNDTD